VGAPAKQGVHPREPQDQMALEKGWHIMPAGASDTRDSDGIAGSPVRTLLLAPGRAPADLYDAMRARRGYATLDESLRVHFGLDRAIRSARRDRAGPCGRPAPPGSR